MKVEFFAVIDPEHPDRVYVSTVPPGVERRAALEREGLRMFQITADLPLGEQPIEAVDGTVVPSKEERFQYLGKTVTRYARFSETCDHRFPQQQNPSRVGVITRVGSSGVHVQWNDSNGGALITWEWFLEMLESRVMEVS